jgi:riboflavin biosynthesis pyrimidine reductase
MEVVWYTAMSMDGRIADAEDDLSFLDTIGERAEDGGDEFATFLAAIDAVVVGAGTMRWLLREGHGWPHDDLPTWLVSHDHGLLEQVGKTRSPLRLAEGDLAQMFADIEEAGHRRVWLSGGGDIAGQALAADRIDEVVATVAPTAVGAGPALFDGAALPRRRFRLVECTSSGGDAARLRWVRDAA